MDKKAIVLEAINELHISDKPGLYKQIRRFLRKNIKRQPIDAIDIINWPKGCLAVGLMNQAIYLSDADNSADRALSLYAMSEVKAYIDGWIREGADVYKIDDALMGQALLMLADMIPKNDVYINAARNIMEFLYEQPADAEGSLPYRPMQKNGRIFADGVGMVAPFAIKYGLMNSDEEALELGFNQISNFVKYGLDEKTGLPHHAYSLKTNLQSPQNEEDGNGVEYFGDLGWGRACGWVMYAVGASLAAFDAVSAQKRAQSLSEEEEIPVRSTQLSFYETRVRDELKNIQKHLSDTLINYKKENGTYASPVQDDDAPTDTSATAMIMYGMKNYADIDISALEQFVSEDGRVYQAQGECRDFGLYGDYGSYPWSVGMTLCHEI